MPTAAPEARRAPAPLASPGPDGMGGAGGWLAVGIAYAVLVSPFIGGIRGVPTYAGWLLIPLAWGWRTGAFAELGVRRPTVRAFRLLAACGAFGALVGGAYLLAAARYPVLLEFVPAIPALHRDVTGGSAWIFLAMIPVAHVSHELFYRGFLQSRLAAGLGSPAAAVLLGAVLFAWTHVFVFSSAEFHEALAATVPGGMPASAEATLRALALFVFVESLIAGALFHRTRHLVAPVAFRAANLAVICTVLFSRGGAL